MGIFNALGLGTIRFQLPNYQVLTSYSLCCFFVANNANYALATELEPKLYPFVDKCNTWDFDANFDFQFQDPPAVSQCWDIDGSGDVMPAN